MFTRKQVRLLTPFLWHYPAHSPWKPLLACVVAIAIFSAVAPRLPLVFPAMAKASPKARLAAIEKENALGRPFSADTQPALARATRRLASPVGFLPEAQ